MSKRNFTTDIDLCVDWSTVFLRMTAVDGHCLMVSLEVSFVAFNIVYPSYTVLNAKDMT